MKTSWMIALLMLCACMLFACSDDKPKSSTADSGSADKTDEEPRADNAAKNGGADQSGKNSLGDADDLPPSLGEDDSMDDRGLPADNPADKPEEKPADTSDTKRGFADSSQTEDAKLEGTELNTGQQYKNGERLKITHLGFSYVVPNGSVCALAPGGAAIEAAEQGKDMLSLIFARTGVTKTEARDLINREFDLGANNDQSKMKPTGEITTEGDRMRRRFESSTLVGFADVVMGKHTTVGVLTVGAAGEAEFLRNYSRKLMDSVRFAPPGGEKDRVKYENDLKGKAVKVFIYKSGGTGYGGTSWSSETNKHWHFGSDGTYSYFYQHTGSSSFDNPSERGGHAADTNENHEGTWSIELTLSGAVMVLRDTRSVIHVHALTLKEGRLHVDGDESTVGPSDKKR